jgi:GAF domain-containing protein
MDGSMKPSIPDELLDEWQSIVDLIAELLETPEAILTRLDLPMIEVLRATRRPDTVYKTGDTADLAGLYCEEVIRTQKPLFLEDARRSERWHDAPEVEHNLVSYQGYPVSWPDGEPFGTLCILDSRPRSPDPRSKQILARFSSMVEAHLELLWKNLKLRRSLEEIQTLRGILPICARCKKVRDSRGYWQQVEQYVSSHTQAVFSHGLCNECEAHYLGNVKNATSQSKA